MSLSSTARWGAISALVCAALAACGAPAPSLPERATQQLEANLTGLEATPMCQLGCLGPGPDPNPQAPGEWIGSDFTEDLCIGGSSDWDFDSLGDLCELRLAEAFAPEMVTWTRQDGGTAEDIGGERYWAARYVSESSPFAGTVMLMYMPAYYRDLGDPESGLTAHVGDSEVVVLYVRYDPATLHWVLKAAHLSAHEDYGYAGSDLGDIQSTAAMEYPARTGGHPRVWVAKFKHANYATRRKCLAGGFLGADYCDTLTASAKWRFPIYESHNLGSQSHRFVDCVNAKFREGWRMECMWATSGKFHGWMYEPNPSAGSKPHGVRLQTFGFIP